MYCTFSPDVIFGPLIQSLNFSGTLAFEGGNEVTIYDAFDMLV